MLEHMDTTQLTEEERAVYREIEAWKFNNDIDEVGPSIWALWYEHLHELLWDELRDDKIALTSPYAYQTIHLVKTQPDHAFMDIVATEDKTENASDLFLLAFQKTVKAIAEYKGDYNWGDYKGTYAGHLLQGLPAFSRFNIPISGGRSIVNAASKNHGPSWRMIVEMSSPPSALGIYPGGQSGNPVVATTTIL